MGKAKLTENHVWRTAKIPLQLSRRQRSHVRSLMAASRWLWNELVEALNLLRSPIYSIHPACPSRVKMAPEGKRVANTDFTPHDGEIGRFYFRDDSWVLDAWRYIKALAERKPFDPEAKSKYGISSKQASTLCQKFRSSLQSYFSHRKKGNYKAKPPCRFTGRKLWTVDSTESRIRGGTLELGTKTQIGGIVSIPLPRQFRDAEINQAEISCDDSGQFWLHLSYQRAKKIEPDLTQKAGIDMGQKRAMAISLANGKTVTLSGKDICHIKRTRDRRQREIQRQRARTFRGQIRFYLSPEERETMEALEAKATGQGTKYARRMVAQRRKEAFEHLPDEEKQRKRLHKRSRRDWKLLRALRKMKAVARRKLDYANHCATRRAADWLRENKVGDVYVGKCDLPKRRKKGKRRLKQVKRNSLWEAPTQVKLLEQKLEEYGATLHEVSEKYSSQTCPSCGARRKPHGRLYRCKKCGWTGDRDGVGAANILSDSLDLQTRVIPRPPKPLALSPATNRKTAAATLAAAARSPLEGRPTGGGLPERSDRGDASAREPVAVAAVPRTKSDRNAHEGRTAVSGVVKEVRANRASLPTPGIAATERSHDTEANNRKRTRRRRFAEIPPEVGLQLSLWDTAPETG